MQLVENTRTLENNHHEGDKQGNAAQLEALSLMMSHGNAKIGQNEEQSKELVKNGVLPEFNLEGKLDNAGKHGGRAGFCGVSEAESMGKHGGSGGGGGLHRAGEAEGHDDVARRH